MRVENLSPLLCCRRRASASPRPPSVIQVHHHASSAAAQRRMSTDLSLPPPRSYNVVPPSIIRVSQKIASGQTMSFSTSSSSNSPTPPLSSTSPPPRRQQQQQAVGKIVARKPPPAKQQPVSNMLVRAGLPFVLFSVLSLWVVSNAVHGRIKEYEASIGKVSKSLRQAQLEAEHDEMMERIGKAVEKDFDNTKRIKRPNEILEERRQERERRNAWHRRAFRWITGKQDETRDS